MKVYFHEDQVKEDLQPESEPPEGLSKAGSKKRRTGISPIISVIALVAVGAGTFAFKKTPNNYDESKLAYTSPSVQKERIPLKQPGYAADPVSQQLPTTIATITAPTVNDESYSTSTKEAFQPKKEVTLAKVSLPEKSKRVLPIPLVTTKVVPQKTAEREPVRANTITNAKVAPTPVESPLQGSRMERARILFSQQKYYDACALSRLEMSNGNKAQRHEAVIMTAQCYLQLGYKPTAQHLLEFVVSEGGPGKEDARRILEETRK